MTEPQTASGLMDQIHDLKRQLADAEKRANERKWECDNLHVGVYTWDEAVAALASAGVAAELEERGLPGAIEALIEQRDDAEKHGAVKALRIEAMRGLEAVEKARQRPDGLFRDFASHLMKGLSDELARRADAIESGDVTL